MKIWHQFQAWHLQRRARKQHFKLQRYIPETAHEICAWQEDIFLLESEARRHLELTGFVPATKEEDGENIISLAEGRQAGLTEAYSHS